MDIKETYRVEKFETNNFLKKIINIFLIPILNSIPESFQDNLRRTHKSADEIIEHATTHKAIEILYVEEARHKSKTLKHMFFHLIWFNTNNAKALRNRLKLVKFKLRENIESKLKESGNIHILNIASGSARGVIEVLEGFTEEQQKRISVVFLDKNPEALLYSKELIESKYIYSNLEWVESTIGNFFSSYKGGNFDIIEIVGLLDYFDDDQIRKTFTGIHSNLNEKGITLAGNISDNKERKFITNAVGWKMIYRSADRFEELLNEVGFDKNKISADYEPLGIHFVTSGVK